MKQISWVALLAGSLALTGCASTRVQEGAVLGGITGALIGSSFGHHGHHGGSGEGALIGAGIGVIAGALLADAEERRYQEYRRETVVYAPPSAPVPPRPPAPATHGSVRSYKIENRAPENGHWETHIFRGDTGERYEERVWIPNP